MRCGAFVSLRRQETGYHLGFKVDGWITKADGVSVEGTESNVDARVQGAEGGTVLYAESIRMCGDDHNHVSNGRHIRRVLFPQVLREAADKFEAGGHSLGAIVRYMEVKHGLLINIPSLRRRFEEQRERSHPSACDAARLIETLCEEQAAEPALRCVFRLRRRGSEIHLAKCGGCVQSGFVTTAVLVSSLASALSEKQLLIATICRCYLYPGAQTRGEFECSLWPLHKLKTSGQRSGYCDDSKML